MKKKLLIILIFPLILSSCSNGNKRHEIKYFNEVPYSEYYVALGNAEKTYRNIVSNCHLTDLIIESESEIITTEKQTLSNSRVIEEKVVVKSVAKIEYDQDIKSVYSQGETLTNTVSKTNNIESIVKENIVYQRDGNNVYLIDLNENSYQETINTTNIIDTTIRTIFDASLVLFQNVKGTKPKYYLDDSIITFIMEEENIMDNKITSKKKVVSQIDIKDEYVALLLDSFVVEYKYEDDMVLETSLETYSYSRLDLKKVEIPTYNIENFYQK